MSENKLDLCIVPRWGALQNMEWYDWLCAQEVVQSNFDRVIRPDLEDHETPTIEAWVSTLQAAVGTSPEAIGRTFFVGHSVGCQAIVRFLATLPEGSQAAGALLVAGWWQLDEPWESIQPWVLDESDPASREMLARAKTSSAQYRVLISDNDPFTANWRETIREWQEHLRAEVFVCPEAGHFNGAESPEAARSLNAYFKK